MSIKKDKTNKITLIVPQDPSREISFFNIENLNKNKVELAIIRGLNPSKNRNEGIEKALKTNTEFIAFTNAHSFLPENWSFEVEKFFNEHPDIDLVGGPQLTPKNSSVFERASGYALSSAFGAGGVKLRYKGKKMVLNADETMITSANLVCKRKVFNKLKFDENLYPGEDPKFVSDAKDNGFKIAYSPEIFVYNKRRTSFSELAKQIFSYGKTRPEKEGIKNTIKKPFFLIPSIFLFYLIFLMLYIDLSLITGNKIEIIFTLPVILYLFMTVYFSLINSVKNKEFLSMFLLLFIYPLIHLSYGYGFIYGTIKKKEKSKYKAINFKNKNLLVDK